MPSLEKEVFLSSGKTAERHNMKEGGRRDKKREREIDSLSGSQQSCIDMRNNFSMRLRFRCPFDVGILERARYRGTVLYFIILLLI